MKKNKKKVREIIARQMEIRERIREIADEADKRDDKALTDTEKSEREALLREYESNRAEIIVSAGAETAVTADINSREEFSRQLREIYLHPGQVMILSRAAPIDTTHVADGGLAPLTILEIQKPLEQGLIFDKVGLPFSGGLSGEYVWPFVGAVEASIAGEKVKLSDTDMNFSKMKPKPVRFGIKIPITSQAINSSDGKAYDIIMQQLPFAFTRALNRAMFCTEKYNADFYGPFAVAKDTGTFAGSVPTYKELVAMKGNVLSEGVEADGLCYVMSEAMKAILEATPKDAGSGLMIVQDGKINGYPVFCTNFIDYKKDGTAKDKRSIGFGSFLYQPSGQFGDYRIIIDPYTDAASDQVNVVVNTDFSTTTLRTEAFSLYTCGTDPTR